jgi:hypothetical protein
LAPHIRTSLATEAKWLFGVLGFFALLSIGGGVWFLWWCIGGL